MPGFLIAVLVAVAATLLLLLRPLIWRRAATAAASHRQLNAAIYRDQFAELERDRAEGTLAEEDYQQARAELQRRVLEDGQDGEAVAAPAPAPKKTLAAIALAVPVAAIALYLLLGNPAGLNPPAPQQRFTAQEIENMVAGLAAKLEKEPDNVQGWTMLARSYRAMGRLPEAEKAFERAEKFIANDAQLLADYADVAAANAQGDFAGKPMRLIEQALELDPDNLQALWLAGSAAFARADFARAVGHWERLVAQIPPDSEDAQMLRANIEEARSALGQGKVKKSK